MKFFIAAVLTLTATLASADSDFHPRRVARILGGSTVEANSIPFQAAALVTSPRFTAFCGATLISARGVLTVAHCLDEASSAQIILGAHDFTHVEPTQQRFTVNRDNFRIHPSYNWRTFSNDIGIVLLPGQGANLNEFVQPVALPAIGVADLFAGELATVSGWGETAIGGEQGSSLLRSAQNNIITNAVCRSFFLTIEDNIVCISTAGNRGPCGKDAGGPLTVNNSNGERVLVGLINFSSTGGCGNGVPVASVRITSFTQWIANTLAA